MFSFGSKTERAGDGDVVQWLAL